MKKQHFTLIELLVTMSIIILLTGILIPAVNGSMKKAENTKCKAEMATLLNALKQYESTYGALPTFGASGTIPYTSAQYTAVINILQGSASQTVGSNTITNPRQIKFIEVKDNDPGEYNDPWGNQYQIVIDAGYGDSITNKDTSSTPASYNVKGLNADTLHYGIFIWSLGPDGAAANDLNDSDNKDNVYGVSTSYQKDQKYHIITK